MHKKHIIRGLVFVPRHIGDAVFLTSYLNACLKKITYQLQNNGSLKKTESLSYQLTLFAYQASSSLYENFPHDKMYIQDSWTFRKLWVVLILLFRFLFFHKNYAFCVTSKSLNWLKFTQIFRPSKAYPSLSPLLYSTSLHYLMPGNQYHYLHIPYTPLIPLRKEDKTNTFSSYFMIAPFSAIASKNWKLKNWNIVLSAMNILYPNYQFLFVGSKEDKNAMLPFLSFVNRGHMVLGYPLPKIARMIIDADLFIGVDSGNLNLAISMVYQGHKKTIILGLCALLESVLNPIKFKNITFITPTAQFPFDLISYQQELNRLMLQTKNNLSSPLSVLDQLSPHRVLDEIKEHRFFE